MIEQMEYILFKQRFENTIADGLSREQFIIKYQRNEKDLEMFDMLKANLEQEHERNEMFLKGFEG